MKNDNKNMQLSYLYRKVYFFLSILSIFSTHPFGCCRDTYKKRQLQENLWRAIHEKRLGKIKQALNKGADPNDAGIMRLAIESNNSKIVALLIAFGAIVCDEHCIYAENLDTQSLYRDRLLPLLYPIKNNKIIQLLKKHRQKRDASIRSYLKNLIVYAQYCWLNTSEKNRLLRDLFKNLLHTPEPNTIVNIKLLLEAGADPIDKHNCLYTPSSLKLAILTNNSEIISLALSYVSKQGEIHAQEIMSEMLALPAHLKNITYEFLLKKGANPNKWDRFSKVIKYEHETEKTQLLLQYGADIYAKRALIQPTELCMATIYTESPLEKAIKVVQNKPHAHNSHLNLLISFICKKCFFTPPEKSEKTSLLLCLKHLAKNNPVYLQAYSFFARIFKLENNRRKEKLQDPRKIRNLLPKLDQLKDQELREKLQNKLKKLIDESNKKKPTN